MSRLNYFIELLKSKINSIKNNLSKNIQIQPTIDEVFDNLDKSVKSGLENKFKAAISKVDRCKPRPYIAGVRFKTRKPKVRINNSFVSTPQPSQPVSPAPLSLNSSVSSIASSNQNQHKSILRSNPGSINQNYSESLQINQSAPSSSSTSSFNNNRVHSSSSSGQNIQQLSSSTQSHSSNSQSRFKNTFFNKNSAFDPYKTAWLHDFSFTSNILNIKSDRNIYKVGKRVFLYDKLNFDDNFIIDIININDKGSKFIPCMHFNHFHIFKNLLYNFYSSLSLFNRNYLFNKNSQPYLDTSPNITLDILDNNIYSECYSLKCFFNTSVNVVLLYINSM